jgi:hypothetical protein
MNIEDILIQALDEPRSYTQWYQEATRLRKENQQSLSKTTFNDAKKRLENENIIFSKEINGREKQFSINENFKKIYKSILKRENLVNEQLIAAKNLVDIVNLLDRHYHKEKKYFAKDKDLYEYLVFNIHQITLSQGFLSLHSSLLGKSNLVRKKIEEIMKKSNLVLETDFKYARQLSPNLFSRVYFTVNNRISDEINKEKSPRVDIYSKYLQRLKKQSRVKNSKLT